MCRLFRAAHVRKPVETIEVQRPMAVGEKLDDKYAVPYPLLPGDQAYIAEGAIRCVVRLSREGRHATLTVVPEGEASGT